MTLKGIGSKSGIKRDVFTIKTDSKIKRDVFSTSNAAIFGTGLQFGTGIQAIKNNVIKNSVNSGTAGQVAGGMQIRSALTNFFSPGGDTYGFAGGQLGLNRGVLNGATGTAGQFTFGTAVQRAGHDLFAGTSVGVLGTDYGYRSGQLGINNSVGGIVNNSAGAYAQASVNAAQHQVAQDTLFAGITGEQLAAVGATAVTALGIAALVATAPAWAPAAGAAAGILVISDGISAAIANRTGNIQA